MNQIVYLELLCEYSLEFTSVSMFQQDGARTDTARFVTQCLDDCMVLFKKDWPGNSSNLNPIMINQSINQSWLK